VRATLLVMNLLKFIEAGFFYLSPFAGPGILDDTLRT
jgi:hypothetical protein